MPSAWRRLSRSADDVSERSNDLPAILAALGTMQEALALDGYLLVPTMSEGEVRLSIEAGPDACQDCLAPDPVLAAIAGDALARHQIELSVRIIHQS
jgi:hypothetical protein